MSFSWSFDFSRRYRRVAKKRPLELIANPVKFRRGFHAREGFALFQWIGKPLCETKYRWGGHDPLSSAAGRRLLLAAASRNIEKTAPAL